MNMDHSCRAVACAVSLMLIGLLPGSRNAVAEDSPPAADASVPEVEVDAVIIEAAPVEREPTIEELFQLFRDQLAKDRSLTTPKERPLGGGLVQVDTRYGRFCVPTENNFTWSSLTGSFGLVSRCAFF